MEQRGVPEQWIVVKLLSGNCSAILGARSAPGITTVTFLHQRGVPEQMKCVPPVEKNIGGKQIIGGKTNAVRAETLIWDSILTRNHCFRKVSYGFLLRL